MSPASEPRHLLVVDDDDRIRELIKEYLARAGFRVSTAPDAAAARKLVEQLAFDLLVLDVMMPGENGFAFATWLRGRPGEMGRTPVLILTARGLPDDRIAGLALGADDYLAKPFDLGILIARIRGLLRRREWLVGSMASPAAEPPPSAAFTFGDKTIDFAALELRVRGEVFPLTLMEVNVLKYLIEHEGKPVSRKKMLDEVWGLHEDTDTRAIDNFIVRLRRYIEDDPTHPTHLLTVRGVGYRFIAEPPAKT